MSNYLIDTPLSSPLQYLLVKYTKWPDLSYSSKVFSLLPSSVFAVCSNCLNVELNDRLLALTGATHNVATCCVSFTTCLLIRLRPDLKYPCYSSS